jgi:membrane protein required for beta-lactamase induction
MIDWIALVSNALWILGCSAGLATLSYASWQASIRGEKFTAQLKRVPIQISLNIAGLLFCLGLAATSGASLETVLWAILAIAFAAQVISLVIGRRRAKPDKGA